MKSESCEVAPLFFHLPLPGMAVCFLSLLLICSKRRRISILRVLSTQGIEMKKEGERR
jgi:hypothetical protein